MPSSLYSPGQSVDVGQFDGQPVTVEYSYFLGFGEDPDESGWTEQVTADSGLEVTAWLACRWEDRINLIRALRGQVRMQGLSVQRIAPSFELKPPFADAGMQWDRFLCTSIGEMQRIKTKTRQDGDDVPGGIYSDHVVMPCNFEVPLYQVDKGPYTQGDPSGKAYTTTIMKPEGEVVCPPSGAYHFKQRDGAVGPPQFVQDTQVGFYFGRTELTIIRKFMPYSGADQIQSVIGCVNENALKFPEISFPAGTVLLMNIDSRPYADPGSGRTVWDITYYCSVNAGKNGTTAVPWTQVMNSKGVYTEILNSDGDPPFPSIDLEAEIWYDQINAA